ncbi:MAG: transporter [Opitutaceae bacterium]|nr:transporter [Opitutaceae bacterium]
MCPSNRSDWLDPLPGWRRRLAGWLFLAGGALGFGQATEWPHTVAPGRFLIEMDALSAAVDREAAERYTAFGAATTFVSTGVTANWDVQIGVEFFVSRKFEAEGSRERHSGVGDVFLRTKWRFLASESRGVALALLPYVKVPTNSGGVGNDAIEGGLIVPAEAALPGGFGLGAQVEVDLHRNDADDGYDAYGYASAALSRALAGRFGAYLEVAAGKSSGGAPWEGTAGAGVTWQAAENLSWDLALYRGVTRVATDWNPVFRLNFEF